MESFSAGRGGDARLARELREVGEDAEADAKHFYRSENGIVLVTREMLDKLKQQ